MWTSCPQLSPASFSRARLTPCFLSTSGVANCVNLGPRPVTTSSQQCLGQLADCCQRGFRLNQFVKVPDLTTLTQEPDWACPHTYQAILSKTPDR